MPPNCDDCQQPVIWALTTANRKWISLDPEPDPGGRQAAYRDHTKTLRTRQLKKDEEPLGFERLYMIHRATCTARQPPPVPPKNVTPITRAPSWRGPRPPKGTS